MNAGRGGDAIGRVEQANLSQQRFPGFGTGRIDCVRHAIGFADGGGVMDGLPMDEFQRQMTGNFGVALTGVGGEVLFGVDYSSTCFGEQGAQNIQRFATANEPVGATLTHVPVQGMQVFVEEIAPAVGGGIKALVEEEGRDHGAGFEGSVKRRVVLQAQVASSSIHRPSSVKRRVVLQAQVAAFAPAIGRNCA